MFFQSRYSLIGDFSRGYKKLLSSFQIESHEFFQLTEGILFFRRYFDHGFSNCNYNK